MLTMLNKISGSVLGSILYPLKTLFISMAFISATVLLALGGFLVFPFFLAMLPQSRHGESLFFKRFQVWLVSFLALLVLGPIIGAGLVIVQLYWALKDFFKSFVLGITDGFENGLFFHVLTRTLFDFQVFSSGLQCIERYLANMGYESPPPNRGYGVYRAPPQPVQYILSPDEIEKARKIGGLAAELAEQYLDLNNRLAKLDQAMANEGVLFNDEIDGEPIEKPALLIKQYTDAQGTPIIISTEIIDERRLGRKLVNNGNLHPLTHENIPFANPYEVEGESYQTFYEVSPYVNRYQTQESAQCCIAIREIIRSTEQRDRENTERRRWGNTKSATRKDGQSHTLWPDIGQEDQNPYSDEENNLSYSSNAY